MRAIELTKGMVATVDDEDYQSVSRHKWHALVGTHHVYAVRSVRDDGRKRMIYMHRQITNAPDGMDVDHINGDTVDNSRANLRVSTRSDNMCNQGPSRASTSGYKGVRFHKKHQRWYAAIKKEGKSHHLGHYKTAEEAARAYDKAARNLHGEFAYQNFQ